MTTYYARYKTAPATPAVVLVQARGEVVDLDPARNVGLVRIRPGRVLPTIPIVPPSWRAKRGVEARTLLRGVNSEGDYACRLLDVDVEETVDGVKYQAFECDRSPQSSGVGGPLMVLDPPALAGVCNYSDMTKDAGLYAAPSMIYHILDANGLSHVYGKGNESLGLAPAAPFRGVPASQPAPAPSTSPAGADVDRVGRVERKVDEIDRKLDEILKAVGSPGAR